MLTCCVTAVRWYREIGRFERIAGCTTRYNEMAVARAQEQRHFTTRLERCLECRNAVERYFSLSNPPLKRADLFRRQLFEGDSRSRKEELSEFSPVDSLVVQFNGKLGMKDEGVSRRARYRAAELPVCHVCDEGLPTRAMSFSPGRRRPKLIRQSLIAWPMALFRRHPYP
jgi:hypothetical protein